MPVTPCVKRCRFICSESRIIFTRSIPTLFPHVSLTHMLRSQSFFWRSRVPYMPPGSEQTTKDERRRDSYIYMISILNSLARFDYFYSLFACANILLLGGFSSVRNVVWIASGPGRICLIRNHTRQYHILYVNRPMERMGLIPPVGG